MASCTKIDGPDEIVNIYINLTDKPVVVQAFRMHIPMPGDEQEPYLIKEEEFIDAQDTVKWVDNIAVHNPDSVYVIFNNERILKWYPDSREEEHSMYNICNYEHITEPYPQCIYRFTETHWEMAEEMKTE